MEIKLNIPNRLFFSLLALAVIIAIGLSVVAVVPPNGHSPNEIDWSQAITQPIKASGFCIGNDCKAAWSEVGALLPSVREVGGHVGIGITPPANPGDMLHIAAAGEGGFTLATPGAQLRIYEDSNNPEYIRFRPVGSGVIFSNNGDTPILTIKQNGRVGIGTSTPASEFEISTSGANNPSVILRQNQANLGGDISFYEGSVYSSLLRFHPGGGLEFQDRDPTAVSRLFIAADGKVGIGTSSPGAALDVLSDKTKSYPIRALASGTAKTLAGFYEDESGDGTMYVQSKEGKWSSIKSEGTSVIQGSLEVKGGTTIDGPVTINGKLNLDCVKKDGGTINNHVMVSCPSGYMVLTGSCVGTDEFFIIKEAGPPGKFSCHGWDGAAIHPIGICCKIDMPS